MRTGSGGVERVYFASSAAGLPTVVIDLNTDPGDSRLAGTTAFKGDCRQVELLERAGAKEARAVVIVTSDDLVNISTALLVRRMNPTARVVVRMFNQNLIARFAGAVKNTVALSVSALIAPVLALTAVTGDAIGAFRLDDGARQVSELVAVEGSELVGQRIATLAREHNLVPLAHVPAAGAPRLLLNVNTDATLAPGDRLIVCGPPQAARPVAPATARRPVAWCAVGRRGAALVSHRSAHPAGSRSRGEDHHAHLVRDDLRQHAHLPLRVRLRLGRRFVPNGEHRRDR